MTVDTEALPRWDLTNVYPNLDSIEFKQAFESGISMIDDLEKIIAEYNISENENLPAIADIIKARQLLSELIERFNSAFRLLVTLKNFVSSYTTTDSYNSEAMRLQSQIQIQIVRLEQTETLFHYWLGSLGNQFEEIIKNNIKTNAHDYYLRFSAEQSRYLMSEQEEALAAKLSLSGKRAWGKLQGTITSQLSIDFKLDGKVESLSLPAIQNVRRYNSDEAIRHQAFEAEINALENIREPLTACMNGVKGYVNVLSERRDREDALQESLDQAHIDRETFESMMAAIEASFPTFRKYLKAKAKRFNKDALPWWDLFAPVGSSPRKFSWSDARQFILDNFATFSPDLSAFAQRAFDNNWIDAEPRIGKRGGAFCMRIPSVEEPRVLCNFDGSFDQVSTIAHELGHAYHIECQKGMKFLQYQTPMTLAETASIFCETIIQDAALEEASSNEEKLTILESTLIGDTQLIVDITSRLIFEKEVFKRRQEADLSADELCEIITDAQKATYGDSLDENHLHPYMWAWKPHYYREDISFYNFPYAFGLLFSTGLYSVFQQRGPDFVPEFKDLLASTGMANAAELASRFNIDIRTPHFWENSLGIIGKRIDNYLEL
jgi:pepF/M3 family oligoendopeptidase